MNFEQCYQKYLENGFEILESFLTPIEIENLKKECSSLVENMKPPAHCSVFEDQSRDEYFLNSGDKISYFFEKDAVDEKGVLVVDKGRALNKIGHALHWLNPAFKNITFDKRVKDLLRCFGYQDPGVVQSMVIFKHPEIGGVVIPHQDSTFLYTDPLSTIGLWFPLVNTTLNNGCLWFVPGSHKEDKIYQRFVRNPKKDPLLLLTGELPKFDDSLYVPVLTKAGDCVIIHGSVVHKSGKNTSLISRPVYTYHIVEKKETEYSKDNWLQPSEQLPFLSLYDN